MVLEAGMDIATMVLPKEVREGMGRVVMREERRVNWWPRLVRERLASDLGLYNATGQQ